jgi:uncharacterized protein with GYD domain
MGKEIINKRRRCKMVTYIILSQISPGAFREPKEFRKLAAEVSSRIKEECPAVVWKASFATTGRFDVIDIVESDDLKQVERASMIIRACGHAKTETMVATPWKEFLEML